MAEREEVLAGIRESFGQGVQYYRDGDFGQAEQEFVKVLKPLLSKPLMKAMHPENTPFVKAELLGAMYHLGEIYLRDEGRLDHHSKAAAIFQYCAGFARQYDVAIEIGSRHIEQVEEGSVVTADSQYFLRRSHDVEREFLSQIASIGARATRSEDIDVASDASYYEDYQRKIEDYKSDLANIRTIVKEMLNDISDLGIDQIAGRSAAVENIYGISSRFFVNHYQQPTSLSAEVAGVPSSIERVSSGLIQRLLSECYAQLGNPPEGCDHSIIGLGSLALGTMTPWSDLEFAVLINEDREEYREYFRNLTKLLHIKIINLGETPLRSVGIESLNDFRTADEADDWFWDDIIDSGFSFDGPDWHACKHPLGRQGYKAVRKEKNDQGVEETIIEEKPDYELILTPQQLADWRFGSETGAATPTFTTDKHLIQALRSVALIDGSQVLLGEYRDRLHTSDQAQIQIAEVQNLEILKEDVAKFSLKLGDEEEGKLIDVKKDMYRLGDRVVSALADYYDIIAEQEQPLVTLWQMIDIMQEQRKLSPEGAQHLKEALSIATELRLHTYANNEAQGEGMSTYIPAVEHLTKEAKHKLLEKTFHIEGTSILHHFYYVMLKVQEVVERFCNENLCDREEMDLNSDSLYDNSNYNKGMVHARFLEYDQALERMEAAKAEQPENLQILQGLFLLCNRTQIIGEVISLGQKMLSVIKAQNQANNLSHQYIAMGYINLGNAYVQKGEYDAAIECHHKGLDIFKILYASAPNHPYIAMVYNNLGSAYKDKEKYDVAIEYHNKALEIYKVAYVSTPNHPEITRIYNNLGAVCNRKGEYAAAIEYHNKALEIYKVAYASTPNHPSIADSHNSLGNAYGQKGEYDVAIEYFQKALDIQLVTYASTPSHPKVVGVYNSLGNAYFCKGEYKKTLSCVKSGFVHSSALMQLGNQALLEDNQDQARAFYKQINSGLEQIDFSSVNFIQLQFQALSIANKNSALPAVINCQLVLIKVDPNLQYGNHYHKLACFYAAKGNIEEANAAFLRALEHPEVTGDVHTEYAQFLILNKDNLVLPDAAQTIVEHLYSAIASDDVDGLSYVQLDKDGICRVLSDIIKQKNADIEVNPKALAYYLLITHPEYTIEGPEMANALLETFRALAAELSDEVSATLFADAESSIHKGRGEEAEERVIDEPLADLDFTIVVHGAAADEEQGVSITGVVSEGFIK